MKKLFTGLGLFLGGFIIHILFAYLLLIFTSTITIFFSFSLNFTLIIDIIILILASIGTVLIIKLLKNRFNIGVARFITTFQLPVAVLSTAYFIFIKFSVFLLKYS